MQGQRGRGGWLKFSSNSRQQFRPNQQQPLQQTKEKSAQQIQGKVVLLNDSQFEVRSSYHPGLLQLLKSVPSRTYDPATRNWSFHARDYDHFMRLLRDAEPSLRRELRIEPLPSNIAVILARKHRQPQPSATLQASVPSSSHDSGPPDAVQLGQVIGRDLVESLLPFQLRGVQFVIGKGGRALIGDDMGLGKTVQAIACALYYRSTDWPALIVAPSSVRYAWRSQVLRWAGHALSERDILVLDNCKAATSKQESLAPLTIVSYDLLHRCADQLASNCYRTIIFDESHFLKNPKTARSKAAILVAKSANRLLLLSGTPALSRPAELFTQISMIRPKLFPGGFHEFGRRYCDAKQRTWGTDYSGSSNMPELQVLLEDSLMIRRLKSDVLDQLPAKRRQMVVLDPTSLKRKEALSGLAKNVTQAGDNRSASERRGLLLEYFHATARVKVPAVKQYILDLLEASDTRKFLVFAHHSEFLDELDAMLTEHGVARIRIDGRTQPEARHSSAEAFQTDANIRVALLSITAAGTGVNLTAASLVVFGELFWNPGILLQAEDRAYRIGQQNSVCVHYLVAQGTADDHLWPLVQRKLAVLGSAGLNRETFRDAETAYLKLSEDKQACITDFYQAMVEEEESNRALFQEPNGEADGEDNGDTDKAPLPKRYKPTEVKKRKEQLQLAEFFGPLATRASSPASSASSSVTAAAAAATVAVKSATKTSSSISATNADINIDVEALLADIPDEEWDFDWNANT